MAKLTGVEGIIDFILNLKVSNSFLLSSFHMPSACEADLKNGHNSMARKCWYKQINKTVKTNYHGFILFEINIAVLHIG